MFREFKVGDLFDVVGRGTRLTKQNRIVGHVPLVTAGRENQGVAEYIQKNKQLFRGPVFTIDMFGNAFARDYDFYADDNIIVFGRDGLSIDHYLYVVSALSHLLNLYGYGNQFRLNSIENTFIQLPVKPGTDAVIYTQDDIDWDYMESTIRELEESTIRELEESTIRELDAYLKETGLDDYQLTDVDQVLLKREPVFRDFKVGELLDCSTTKGYNPNKCDLPNGKTPYVTRSAFNNGISGFFDDGSGVFMNSGNCITIGAEGGAAFYQPDDFIAGIKVYTLRHERMTCEIGMYLCSALNTYSHIYSYTNARILYKIKNESIQLPVKPGIDPSNYTQDDIDWDYMESYIRVMEKRVIADVVDYKNEVIALTKDVCHK